eukprot:12581201-Heterocapsa_arctica.AAC.1
MHTTNNSLLVVLLLSFCIFCLNKHKPTQQTKQRDATTGKRCAQSRRPTSVRPESNLRRRAGRGSTHCRGMPANLYMRRAGNHHF